MRKRDARPWRVDDDLWARIEPLRPKQPLRSSPGRRPVDDRKVLCGTLFVLFTGIRWEWLLSCAGEGRASWVSAGELRLAGWRSRLGLARLCWWLGREVDDPVVVVSELVEAGL
jgi:transposase